MSVEGFVVDVAALEQFVGGIAVAAGDNYSASCEANGRMWVL